MKFYLSLLLSLFLSLAHCHSQQNDWTIIYYAAGSNSSEIDLLNDVQQIKENKVTSGYEIIMLIDRIKGHSDDTITLGENFTDTRLYRFDKGKAIELDGGNYMPAFNQQSQVEANMGDADLLKRFIQFCKANYPAKHFMLVLRSHGNGQHMCPDVEGEKVDKLFPGELRDVLSPAESVDILGLDVCSMAGVENCYEWRPTKNKFSADYIIASAPLSGPWPYEHILSQLSNDSLYTDKEDKKRGNLSLLTPLHFSKIIIEKISKHQQWASWGLFDNSKIIVVKAAMDKLAIQLEKEDKSVVIQTIAGSLHYFHNTSEDIEIAQLVFPYVDAYDFCYKLSTNDQLSERAKKHAKMACIAIDDFVISSFYGEGFLPATDSFIKNKSGIYLVAPIGNRVFSKSGRTFWEHTDWFHPGSKRSSENTYGSYDWCSDGATPENNIVDNFFELLDYLFDENNDAGGVNNYNY